MKKKWIILMVVCILALAIIVSAVVNLRPEVKEVALTDFEEWVKDGRISEVTIIGNEVRWKIDLGKEGSLYFKTHEPGDTDELLKFLKKNHVKVHSKPAGGGTAINIIRTLAPVIIFVVILIFVFRMLSAASGVSSTKDQPVSSLPPPAERVTFKDVAGLDEAKEELKEIIEFLKTPTHFTKRGARVPKGVLLMGPPGCGKTLLARAVAGEAKVPFFQKSGSEFIEVYVGVGARRVRDLFGKAKRHAPCIIFIDELDAIGRHRGAGMDGGQREHGQTLNQILVAMDGFDQNASVVVVAATNRPDILDPAFTRRGRFDRHVVVPMPDVKAREAILEVHIKNKLTAKDVNLEILARSTPGLSGADLESLANEAAILSIREKAEKISMTHFERAIDKVMMGAERKSAVISDEEKKIVAYHESGHALANVLTPHTDPLHKVSIIPRGAALGVTIPLPEKDIYLPTKQQLLAKIKELLAGKVAEEIVYGPEKITAGSSSDLKKLTVLAQRMICEFGMSDELGSRTFGDVGSGRFLGGGSPFQNRDYSEDIARKIDKEVNKIIEGAKSEAKTLLSQNRKALDNLAEALMKRETLTGKEVKEIVKKS